MTAESYRERRGQLEEVDLDGRHARIVPIFEDGETLFAEVCERGLEGVVAKRDRDRYRPGERLWVKTKNRAAPRFAEELSGVTRRIERARSASTAR